MSLRLVMMGTGRFALPTFLALYETDHQVVGLFTQPDRSGRGRHRHSNPLKEAAVERGTPVFQPEDVNAADGLEGLRTTDPDLCVVAAYGQILSPELLAIPRLGSINVHASLLPKYRGAAPVQYAVWRGERETGITIFRIEPKLDAGPILAVAKTAIGPKETAGELEERLAEMAAPVVKDLLNRLEAGTVEPIPQETEKVTRAPRLRKSQGAVDWSRPAVDIERHVRAMQPWPTAFTFLERPEGKALRLILLDVDPVEGTAGRQPGEVVAADNEHFTVQTGRGAVVVNTLQPEGKRAMTAAEFLRGHAISPGDRFTASPAD